jgi:hypothetical protein
LRYCRVPRFRVSIRAKGPGARGNRGSVGFGGFPSRSPQHGLSDSFQGQTQWGRALQEGLAIGCAARTSKSFSLSKSRPERSSKSDDVIWSTEKRPGSSGGALGSAASGRGGITLDWSNLKCSYAQLTFGIIDYDHQLVELDWDLYAFIHRIGFLKDRTGETDPLLSRLRSCERIQSFKSPTSYR